MPMDESKWLRDGAITGTGAAAVFSIFHFALYDPEARGIDDADSANLSRAESYAVGVATLIAGLYIWSRYRPEASAPAAIIVLGIEAVVSGAAVQLLHWWRGRDRVVRARAVRDHVEAAERRDAHRETVTSVRPRTH